MRPCLRNFDDLLYHAENHLLAVKYHTETIASYTYDTFGRRSSTSYAPAATYVYDGEHIIAEYNGYGALSRKYIYGPGIDEPICMIVPAGTTEVRYFYHQDALGSIVALSKFDNGSASFVERYSYSAFGETTVTLNGSTGNPYRFTGREYEPETGLYYYRARFYKPDIGRFLQPDPIGYDDGPNMYAYCGNNPTNFIDPLGNMKTFYDYTGSIAVVTYVQNGRKKQMAISSHETIKHILLNAKISGEKISYFEYVGHGYESGGGLAIGSGIMTTTITSDWRELVKSAFASDARIELEGCYSALTPSWDDTSIAGAFKSVLPNATVFGYTGPSKPSFFFAEWLAETHASHIDILGPLRSKIQNDSWGTKGNKGKYSMFYESEWVEVNKSCK